MNSCPFLHFPMLFENVVTSLLFFFFFNGDNCHFPLMAEATLLHLKTTFPQKSCGKGNFCHFHVLIIHGECGRVTLHYL